MFERTTGQKTIINTMMTTLLTGAFIYFAITISQASYLSNSTGTKSVNILGINMLEIFKNPVGDGTYNAGINVNYNGIALYFCIVLLLGALIGYLRLKIYKK